MNKEDLIYELVNKIVEIMDVEDLMQYATESLSQSYSLYSEEELLTEIKEIYPEILDANQ